MVGERSRVYIAGGNIFITSRIKDMIVGTSATPLPQSWRSSVGGVKGMRSGCRRRVSQRFQSTAPTGSCSLLNTLTAQNDIEALRSRIVDVARQSSIWR